MFRFLLSCFHIISVFFVSSFFHHTHTTGVLGTTISPVVSTLTPTDTPTLPPLTTEPMPTVSLAPTDSPTPTPTVSLTPTSTPTPTVTPTPTLSPTPTLTPSPVPSDTPTQSPSPTPSPSQTPTPLPSPTFSPTPTMTTEPTFTPTPTVTLTPTVSLTPTFVPTQIPTPSLSPTPTITPTLKPSPTLSPTPTLSETPTPTLTLTVTSTPTATPTESPTPSTGSGSPAPTPVKVGNDISYPQCGKTLPTGQGFGIVGVNGGIATTTNPCLGAELLWANLSLGTPNQPKVQMYVNTGNPGGLNTASWPKNNIDPLGNLSPNPYGSCDGSDSLACSWQYGWNRSVDDVQNKFIPAAVAAGVDAIPSDYRWWLDVETANSWESGSDAALEKNRVDLEAMVTYFTSKGITVGIYSTAFQWGEIVNTVPSDSNLNGLYSWLPGAQDVSGAQANCSLSSLTLGGSVILTQYTTNNFDYDYSCL